MSNLPSYDDDLLSRLNALKKSSITSLHPDQKLSPTVAKPVQTREAALSDRLRSLRNASASPSPSLGPSPVADKAPLTSPRASQPQQDNTTLFPSTPTTFSKKTSVQVAEPDDQDDPLRNPAMNNIDDKTLDELLADLGIEDQWKLEDDEPDGVRALLEEAKKAGSTSTGKIDSDLLRQKEKFEKVNGAGGNGQGEWSKDDLSKGIDFSVFRTSDDEDEHDKDEVVKLKDSAEQKVKQDAEEDEEADEIVRRMLDEVALEPKTPPRTSSPPPPPSPPKDQPSQKKREANNESDSPFTLPSAPTKLPTSAQPQPTITEDSTIDTDLAARLSALSGLSTNSLGLPSAPSFRPSENTKKEIHTGLSKYEKFTDDDIDSWCVICQEDATVVCKGCEGDLYCANCWKEGHLGSDAGIEERGHKWTKYKRLK